MSELQELLQGAGEAKRLIFASEDFAGGYGRVVIGRVKRRRAMTATAMGGGTVVAVGAIAVGAANVPWGSSGVGASPSGSPSVVCTTTTPDAVVATAPNPPADASFAVVDNATGAVFFAGRVDVLPTAWNADGSVAPVERVTGLRAILTLPSGAEVALSDDDSASTGINVSPADATAVTVMPVEFYMADAASTISVIAEDGTVLGKAIHTSPDALAFFADGRLYALADSGDMTRSYVDSTGQHVHVTLVDDDPSGTHSQPTATPTVTCVTTTPDPSESQTQATSPFACGHKFDAPVHASDGLSISSQKWISSADAQNALLDEFGGQWPAGHPRPTGEVLTAQATLSATLPNGADPLLLQGGRSASDPVDDLARQADFATLSFFAGMTVVGVADGEVVATVPESSLTNKWLYYDAIPRGNDPLGLSVLDTSQALVACGDVKTWDDLYIVAAVGAGTSDGWDMAPVYAWAKVTS